MSSKSIFEHIKRQPAIVVDEIYYSKSSNNAVQQQSVWACKAVFQSLSVLAKCYIMKVLFITSTFSKEEIREWVVPSSEDKHNNTIEQLIELRLFIVDNSDSNSVYYKINPNFQKSFTNGLLNPSDPWHEYTNSSTSNDIDASNKPTLEELDIYCSTKWNEVLEYLVNIKPIEIAPNSIKEILTIHTKLMIEVKKDDNKEYIMSVKGYEYMLQDYISQIWDIVLTCIKISINQEESLSLLFMLAYCEYGKGYPINVLTKSQYNLINYFYDIGIIMKYISPILNIEYFYPTKIAIDMIFGFSSNDETGKIQLYKNNNNNIYSKLQIIVETNMQLVAYLTNDIHLAMLQLFADIYIRMPNMVVGRLTRDKAKSAYKRGISGAQIIDFLSQHCHISIANRKHIIPENVIDQLKLWEKELYRIKSEEAIIIDLKLITSFNNNNYHNNNQYNELINNLKISKVLLWEDEKKMLIAITPNGLTVLENYVSQHFSS